MPQRSGSLGTLDAPGYQAEIARPLIPAAAEWRLAVKKNFRALPIALEACFGQPFEGDLLHARVSRHQITEQLPGQYERRLYDACLTARAGLS